MVDYREFNSCGPTYEFNSCGPILTIHTIAQRQFVSEKLMLSSEKLIQLTNEYAKALNEKDIPKLENLIGDEFLLTAPGLEAPEKKSALAVIKRIFDECKNIHVLESRVFTSETCSFLEIELDVSTEQVSIFVELNEHEKEIIEAISNRDFEMVSKLFDIGFVLTSKGIHAPNRAKAIQAIKDIYQRSQKFNFEIKNHYTTTDNECLVEFHIDRGDQHVNGIDIFRWGEDEKLLDLKAYWNV